MNPNFLESDDSDILLNPILRTQGIVKTIARYKLKKQIGKGAFSTVYLAEN